MTVDAGIPLAVAVCAWHVRALEYAKAKGWQTLLLFEDDAHPDVEPTQTVLDVLGDDIRPPLRHQSLCRPKHPDKRIVTSAIEYASIVLSSIYIGCACVDALSMQASTVLSSTYIGCACVDALSMQV